MKKRISTLLIVIFLVLSFENKAHSQNEFQIDYYSNNSINDLDIFAGVQKTTSGYAIAGMVQGIAAPLIQSILIATDSTGTVTWAKQIKDGGFLSFKNLFVRDLQATADGGSVMTGSFDDTHAMLLKVDGSGNNVFSKTYGNSNEFGNRVKELSSGGYLVAGTTRMKSLNPDKDSTSIYVFKTDANGNYLWGRSYTLTGPVFDSQDEVNDMVETSNGYVFAGYQSQYNGGDTTTNILVFKTDVNGTLQWMKTYGDIGSNEAAFSINNLSNGDVIVGGYTDQVGIGASSIAVLELDPSNGNMVTSTAYSVGLFADQVGSIQQTSTGDIAIIGWTVSVFWQSFLVTLNSAYTPVSGTTYNSFIGGLFTKGIQVPGGYVIGSMIGSTGYQLHMIKTAPNGISGCNETSVTPVQYNYTPSVSSITPSVYTVGSASTFTASLTDIAPVTNIECIVLPLVADAGFDQTICSGVSTSIGGTPTASYGVPGYTYSWSSPSGFTSSDANPIDSPTVTTTYTVTVSDASGATATSSVNVFVVPIPTATASTSGPVCIGGVLALTGGDNGMTAYNWTGPNGFTSTEQSPTVSNNATAAMAGTYTLIVSDGTCSNTDSTTLTVNPLPIAEAGNDVTICQGTSTSLNATGGATYSWSPGTGLNNPNVASPMASPMVSTAYTVIVTSAAGCSAADSLLITVKPAAPVNAGLDSAICIGESVHLSATSAGSGTYSWSPATGLSATNIHNPIATPNTTTTYVVTLSYSNGCSATDNVIVTVNPTPTLVLTSDPPGFVYTGQIITITATPTPADVNAEYYFYVDNILVESGMNNVFQTNSLTTGQVVSATVLENGCMSLIDSINPDIKPIPNAFIPDGDNVTNSKFVPGLDLTIINRWGQQLYEGTEGWDGKYNGDLVSASTYFYVIRLKDLQNVVTVKKGSVTVIRINK